MSLSLIEGYSSAEEDEGERLEVSSSENEYSGEEEDSEDESTRSRSKIEEPSLSNPDPSNNGSLLPSAFDAFSEVAGPPEFLNNCVAEHVLAEDVDQRGRRGWHKNKRDKKDLPAGAVVEAKAQLVKIRERVRSDIDATPTPLSQGKRVSSAANPDAKDAADLLRMCLQCGVPKTFTNAKGMTCPICSDRPPVDLDKESEKKKGSTIKDKEKNKRMKGQSSHATWKSETEMHLRQQFD